MPKPYPAEFRRDVIAVARESDRSVRSVARDFGISETCLQRWLKIADREDQAADGGGRAGRGSSGTGNPADVEELRALRRRNKELEQENEVLRRATAYFARNSLPK